VTLTHSEIKVYSEASALTIANRLILDASPTFFLHTEKFLEESLAIEQQLKDVKYTFTMQLGYCARPNIEDKYFNYLEMDVIFDKTSQNKMNLDNRINFVDNF
jgi:hypothetical protein